eukprot:4865781-Amphidinium_carterae.1
MGISQHRFHPVDTGTRYAGSVSSDLYEASSGCGNSFEPDSWPIRCLASERPRSGNGPVVGLGYTYHSNNKQYHHTAVQHRCCLGGALV